MLSRQLKNRNTAMQSRIASQKQEKQVSKGKSIQSTITKGEAVKTKIIGVVKGNNASTNGAKHDEVIPATVPEDIATSRDCLVGVAENQLKTVLSHAIEGNEQTYDLDDFEDDGDEHKIEDSTKIQGLGGASFQQLSPVRPQVSVEERESPAASVAQVLVQKALDNSLETQKAGGAQNAPKQNETTDDTTATLEFEKARKEAERKKMAARERMKEELRKQLMNEMEAEDSQNSSLDLSLEER